MKKILIANRGEIAVRIIRACKDAGYRSVAITSEADSSARHARLADEVHRLPGNTPVETYLNQPAILAIAAASEADAVHPGYGLLSENAEFAAAVEAAGMIWVGPSAAAIEALGDKVRARKIAEDVGAPLLPASIGDLTLESARDFVARHGLPAIIKAQNGGGGRGMRVLRDIDDLPALLEAAQREAGLAFGRPECFIERYAERARHVETQCLADRHGTVLVLSTRDCTLQRRQQKLVEEAPAPFLSAEQEERLVDASQRILKAVDYVGAATCEFLVTPEGDLSFLEVNTRVQVEHPVTEEVTGIDIIAMMLRIAQGEPLPDALPAPRGHAIEFRINAEDPWADFQPSAGRITGMTLPGGPGVRLDFGYEVGETVPPFYDSLLGKVIVWGSDRANALRRAQRALSELAIAGPKTVAPLHRAVLEREEFTSDLSIHTRWIDEQIAPLTEHARNLVIEAPVLTGAATAVTAEKDEEGPSYRIGIRAPLSGLVLEWLVEEGDMISPGDEIAVMEAMKMEQTVIAEQPGVIACLNVAKGGFIDIGEDLAGMN